jgi:uracil-DNA glycosylase family 4
MKGFFDLPNPVPKPRTQTRTKAGCEGCGLFKQVKSPRMPYSGKGRLKTLIIGEAPGGEEDLRGLQFVGQAGDILRDILKGYGYFLDRDFWKTNALACRPTDARGNNRTPTKREIQCCEPQWRKVVAELKPQFIILMGAKAVEAFYMYRSHPIAKDLSMGRWNRTCVPDVQTGAWVISIPHPSMINYNPDYLEKYRGDVGWALEQLNREPPIFEDWTKRVICITNYDSLINLLNSIARGFGPMAIDYETSGTRPYKPGHHIWSISVAAIIEGPGVWSFPYSYPGHWSKGQFKSINTLWKQILTKPDLVKIGQNIQMEEAWSRRVIGVPVANWTWDTMVAAHVLNEHRKVTSLDFQVFVNFGYEYGAEIEPYKTTVKGTLFNRMHEVPLAKLLEYNGQDALFTALLSEKQSTMVPPLKDAYDLLHEGTLTFNDMSDEGICVDKPYYDKTFDKLTKRIVFLFKKLYVSKEAQLFQAKTGREISLTSPDDLKDLFFKYMEIKPIRTTEKGNISVDEDTLEKINSPFTKDLLKIRKIAKTQTTYVRGISELAVEELGSNCEAGMWKIHPSFNFFPATYRSSSSDPNFQNIPSHDEETKLLVRTGIIPSPGHKIAWADYGGHELRIFACYCKDPALMADIKNNVDIHKYWADFMGVSRFDAKNSFVFAEIYGSYYGSVWKSLLAKGYKKLKESTVRDAEKELWHKYRKAKEWQEEWVKSYYRNGYLEMLTGFRVNGYLSRNQIVNYPIQGTAFHLLLWSCIELNRIRKEEGWVTKIPAQIHDEIFMDIAPDEEEYVRKQVEWVMVEGTKKEFKWINVPLLAEYGSGEVDQPWVAEK